ncbi:MAG: hypothetical protein GXO24_02490 [Chlorobi bacterium]|nr:hypothetical protein [Chlorobiota bacterium]
MKKLQIILAVLLLLWGLFITWMQRLLIMPRFPFLTFILFVALVAGIFKYRKANMLFLMAAGLWILFSSESIGFVIFMDKGGFARMIPALIPLVLSTALLFSTQAKDTLIDAPGKKAAFVLLLIFIGFASFIYKPYTVELECRMPVDYDGTYQLIFISGHKKTLQIKMSKEKLKEIINKKAIYDKDYKEYFCSQTRIKIVTRFGKIISAKHIEV